MRLLCPTHGCQAVKQLSPDLADRLGKRQPEQSMVEVRYAYQGEVVDAYLVSADFADQHGIQPGTFPVSDDWPPWSHLTVLVCLKCFEEARNVEGGKARPQ